MNKDDIEDFEMEAELEMAREREKRDAVIELAKTQVNILIKTDTRLREGYIQTVSPNGKFVKFITATSAGRLALTNLEIADIL